jgi:hypothetical protein
MCQGLDVIQNPSMDGSAVIEKKSASLMFIER